MSKKKKRRTEPKVGDAKLAENELMIYGSANGWIKTIDNNHEEEVFYPAGHTKDDEPATWYILGKYVFKEE